MYWNKAKKKKEKKQIFCQFIWLSFFGKYYVYCPISHMLYQQRCIWFILKQESSNVGCLRSHHFMTAPIMLPEIDVVSYLHPDSYRYLFWSFPRLIAGLILKYARLFHISLDFYWFHWRYGADEVKSLFHVSIKHSSEQLLPLTRNFELHTVSNWSL